MSKPSDLCETRVIHKEKIDKARENSLGVEDVDLVTRTFKAMGDPTRLRILWALQPGELCVCDLAALLEITESAVSHQLRILRHLDLVINRREGTILYYRLNDQHVSQLINMALEHVRE
ncbi:MAG: metalloregulator ArsR/SmtB family transcription factor [bacterium]|nr:metalloregulator ArsR/SmtB family transcription factor [bacterium]MDT8365689.1 metalloregulator ArsR/SmtB family transcription factor [bacterium]